MARNVEEQIVEDRAAIVIEADNLPVDDCVHCIHTAQSCSDVRSEIRPATKCISVPRNKTTFTIFDEREGAEAVELDFEDEIVAVEWTRTP